MSCRQVSPAMRALSTLAFSVAVLLPFLVAQVNAQGSNATVSWKTLRGDPPLVIANGGFSGLFPDSSFDAYRFALMTSVSDVVLFCNVQLTKDGVGICFSDIKLDNASNVAVAYKNRQSTYSVNGVPTKAWFTLDFNAKEFGKISLIQPIYSRTNKFDNNYPVMLVKDVAEQLKPAGYWLNIQYDSFYTQHNLSMRSYVLSVTKSVVVNYISSPEVNFLRSIAGRVSPSVTKLIFRFLEQDVTEPTTNQTYGSLLKNLTFVKTFASGILVPKTYIWPVDPSNYLLPHTSLVQDAHKAGLEVYAADFANDFTMAYNYSYDPITEYLSFVENGDFAVDGVLSDFPISSSEAFDCFSHLSSKAADQVDLLVVSKNGASGDYPGCTDKAYEKAIKDGADIIDCPVQMSSDGVPFCLSSIDLTNSTTIAQSPFNNLSLSVPEIKGAKGIYSFSLSWSQIQTLTPAIENPYTLYQLFRNPKNKNAGSLISLSDFLGLAKNSSSLSGVMINVENAAYLAEKQGLDVVGAVLDALKETGYNNLTSKKVMIQSTNSSVLTEFKQKSNYELVYKIEEEIRDILVSAVDDIKKFASSVVLGKRSVFPVIEQFVTGATDIVTKLQKANITVFAEVFSNEFISQAWDFFSDPTVEINSFVQGAGINGVITDFPKTAARYTKNVCLGDKELPPYMTPAQPGGLLEIVSPQALPPAEAPKPVFTDSDVAEPPLPPVTAKPPASTAEPTDAAPPKPNGQSRVASSILISSLVMLLATLSIL